MPKQGRSDSNGEQVALGVTNGLHPHQRVSHPELARNQPAPKIEFLPDVAQIRHVNRPAVPIGELETDARQMDALRILAQPGHGPPRALRLVGGFRIEDGSPVCIVRPHHLTQLEVLGIRKRMPGPLRHRAEWHPFLIGRGERLKARDVGTEGKLAVSHLKSGCDVGRPQHWVVPFDDGFPIQLATVCRGQRQRRGSRHSGNRLSSCQRASTELRHENCCSASRRPAGAMNLTKIAPHENSSCISCQLQARLKVFLLNPC